MEMKVGKQNQTASLILGGGTRVIKGGTSASLSLSHLAAREPIIQQLDIFSFFGYLLLSYGYLLSRYLATTG